MYHADEGFCSKCRKIVKAVVFGFVFVCSICSSNVSQVIHKPHMDDEPVARSYSELMINPVVMANSGYVSGASGALSSSLEKYGELLK